MKNYAKIFAQSGVFFLLVGSTSIGYNGRADGNELVDRVFIVPLARLLVAPDELTGKTVDTFGYLAGSSSLYLFLTDDHALNADISSALLLRTGGMDGITCKDRYVRVIAEVAAAEGGTVVLANPRAIMYKAEPSDAAQICWSR